VAGEGKKYLPLSLHQKPSNVALCTLVMKQMKRKDAFAA